MTAKELIENNSLTDIEVTGEQAVVFTEIAMTAVNMAREEGANALIDQASANGQKKYQQGIDFMKSKAILIFAQIYDMRTEYSKKEAVDMFERILTKELNDYETNKIQRKKFKR